MSIIHCQIRKLLIALLLGGLLSTPLLGQSLFVEQAESTVVIQQDNLVRAKAEALKDAKAQVILQGVARFLDFNDTVSLKPLLLQHFLKQPDDFIESIRVISEENTSDLTEFTIKIETQIFRSRLLSAFRKLGLHSKLEENRYACREPCRIEDSSKKRSRRDQAYISNSLGDQQRHPK